jgi:hypothetical protein
MWNIMSNCSSREVSKYTGYTDESRNFSLSLYELLLRIKLTERLETKQSPKDAAFALLGLSLLSF